MRHRPLSENCRASTLSGVCRVHSAVLERYSQNAGCQEIPSTIFVLPADCEILTESSLTSGDSAAADAEKLPKNVMIMQMLARNVYSRANLYIATS